MIGYALLLLQPCAFLRWSNSDWLRLILCAGVGDMRSMAVAFCYEDERLWLDQIACQWRGFFLCGTDSADAYPRTF